jgi:hypothetical protein
MLQQMQRRVAQSHNISESLPDFAPFCSDVVMAGARWTSVHVCVGSATCTPNSVLVNLSDIQRNKY